MYPFDLADTPLNNFCGAGYTQTINGKTVSRSDIIELKFGDGYESITYIPNGFITNFNRLTELDLSSFKNVTGIGETFFFNQGLTQRVIKELDFSVIPEIKSIGNYFLSNFPSLEKLNISTLTLTNLNLLPYNTCTEMTSLKELQIGSIDWSNKSTTGSIFTNIYNNENCILRADSEAIATKWKNKFGVFSNWFVIINE
jgi:hypothetical protein